MKNLFVAAVAGLAAASPATAALEQAPALDYAEVSNGVIGAGDGASHAGGVGPSARAHERNGAGVAGAASMGQGAGGALGEHGVANAAQHGGALALLNSNAGGGAP